MAIYTSRINYAGRIISLDITVKGQDSFGKYFAPTWAMVNEFKRNNNQEKYLEQYNIILEENYIKIKELGSYVKRNDLVLKCYCGKNSFCHRFVLANYIKNIFGVEYLGEI